jgi:hypothetical protein
VTRALVAIPALSALAVVPLVVCLHVRPLDGDAFDFWNGQHSNYDFFSYYKAHLLVGASGLALAGLLAAAIRGTSGIRLLPTVVRVTFAGYAAFAIASALTSSSQGVALGGFPDRYEGLFTLLAYLVVAVASFCAFPTAADAGRVVTWLAWSASVIGVIGVAQYVGLDPFRSAWGRALIMPGSASQAAPLLAYPTEARAVYSTLFHYNNVGSYAAMVVPFLVAALATGVVPVRARRVAVAATVLTGVVWLVCGSRAGQLGGALALVTLAFLMRSRLRVRPTILGLSALAVIALIAAADLAISGRIHQRAAAWSADVVRLIAPPPPVVRSLPLELLSIDDSSVRLRIPTGDLEFRHEAGNLAALDGAHQAVRFAMKEEARGRFRLDDPRFADLDCTVGRINGQPALVVRNQGYVLNFLLLESGIRLALKTGRPVPTEPIQSFGFAGRQSLGSGRGFIWSRSLPLLQNALLVGFGPDCFAMMFPQHDFSGKFRVYGTSEMLVDKPHNYYLQTAINTGALSLLALVTFFVWYVTTAVRLQMSAPAHGWAGGLGLACVVGVIGYLLAAFFNDSVVGVAPVFWVLVGLGVRMNVEHGQPNR